ncbi:MAG TPA: DUF4124 domain-containing protein [Thiotrichaceae bacterium]|jgi:ribosomal protein S10|nr:DUF4124 domain-containing protein [Thiotrichaceae bacterium]
MSRIILLITLFFLQINTANSEVYKWLDENGKTVYGDKPTSNNVDEIIIKKPPKQDKHYQERYKKQQQLLNVMQEERDEKVSQKLEEMDKKQKKKEKCAKLIKELQEAKDASLLYEDTDDPNNPKILSDEERKAEEVKYEKYIKENCL